uniref:Glutathione S-transferase 1-1 n=1 Tax=Scolopendra viridis TaxID=118503 RepID=A0A4D5R9W2_SCOVI
MPIDFYYMPASPPCRSVLLTAKALGVELNLKTIDLMQGEHLKPEFTSINPQHTIPTIVDDGFALWESRAILAYLANKYGKDDKLYPKDAQKRGKVDQMLFFDMGTMYKSFGDYVYPQLLKNEPADPEKLKALKVALGHFDTSLQKTKYAAGDQVTIADMTLAASVSTAEACDVDISEYSRIKEWLDQMKALPYYGDNQTGVDMFRQWFLSAK